MYKIYLLIYSKPRKQQFFKYFDSIREKEKYKRKIKYVKDLIIIEDSCDLLYY